MRHAGSGEAEQNRDFNAAKPKTVTAGRMKRVLS